MQEELKQLRLKVRELCIYIHAENMGFGQDEDTRSESLAEVLKQNALGQLGFVRTKAQDIFQQSRINKETKAYQKALMKLEAEIRGRVKIENCLRLQVENLQHDLDVAHAELSLNKSEIAQLRAESVYSVKKSLEHKETQTSGTKVPNLRDKIVVIQKSPRLIKAEERRSICKNLTAHPERLELKRSILQLSLNESAGKSLMLSQRMKGQDFSPIVKSKGKVMRKPDRVSKFNKPTPGIEYNDEFLKPSLMYKPRSEVLLARSKSTSRARP